MIRYFYKMGFDDGGRNQEPDWDELIRRLRTWRHERPRSITAHVALATALVGWAWEARGGGYAYTVTDRGRQLWQDRLGQAKRVLDEARQLDTTCPGWWMATQRVALGQGWSPHRAAGLYQEAISAFPSYDEYTSHRAYSLLPRWHGAEGEWERFAKAAAEAMPDPDDGDARYAMIIWSQMFFFEKNVFREADVSWPRARRGFQALMRRHPESVEIPSQFCHLAMLAEDVDQARALFDHLGMRCDMAVWESPQVFLDTRSWVLARTRGMIRTDSIAT